MTQLDTLEEVVGQTMNVESLAMVAREIIKIARQKALEDRLEAARLRAMLRTALRNWILRTPDVEEAVLAWEMAQVAGV